MGSSYTETRHPAETGEKGAGPPRPRTKLDELWLNLTETQGGHGLIHFHGAFVPCAYHTRVKVRMSSPVC